MVSFYRYLIYCIPSFAVYKVFLNDWLRAEVVTCVNSVDIVTATEARRCTTQTPLDRVRGSNRTPQRTWSCSEAKKEHRHKAQEMRMSFDGSVDDACQFNVAESALTSICNLIGTPGHD